MTYEDLKRKAQRLQRDGVLHVELTAEERADWAYGNTAIENGQITLEMAEQAAARLSRE